MDALRHLLVDPPPERAIDSPSACFEMLEALDAALADSSTIDRAAIGGFAADRLGYAFLAGYRAALARVDPTLSRASLCATESGGAHPRAIATRLEPRDDGFALTGDKTFATLASSAATLLVVASSGRNSLHVARIPADRAGVTIADREAMPFAPEIPHARVALRGVRVARDEVLEGDGYLRLLKPFRTLEDMHVAAAWLGHVVRLVRLFGEPRDLADRALAALAALRDLGRRDPLDAVLHVALAGVFTDAHAVAAGCTLAAADEATRARWQRDLPLFAVAGQARDLRRTAAWTALEGTKPPPAP